jgi:hypothetical protein
MSVRPSSPGQAEGKSKLARPGNLVQQRPNAFKDGIPAQRTIYSSSGADIPLIDGKVNCLKLLTAFAAEPGRRRRGGVTKSQPVVVAIIKR